ncbi:MAG: hypothetical protein EAZ76_02560 [Nostocales cyanobacterium]|nr:MAG: hypothetical protein EAZ87_18655 [Nostocales cyanobacterium]TAF19864.1 MAG: hypothetical protein EAZ76_02560 [Nostocales cyanobacterium]
MQVIKNNELFTQVAVEESSFVSGGMLGVADTYDSGKGSKYHNNLNFGLFNAAAYITVADKFGIGQGGDDRDSDRGGRSNGIVENTALWLLLGFH